MFALARHRPLVWIALFAWFAQLCLPAAHAAVMAAQDTGITAWCGKDTPGLRAQLAQLDDELRQILDPRGTQAQTHGDCALFCASAHGADLVPAPVSVQLRAAGPAARAIEVIDAARDALSHSPPARGPPHNT